MSRLDPVVKVSLAGDIIRDDFARVGKFIDDFNRLSVDVNVDAEVRCCFSEGRLDEDLCLFDKDPLLSFVSAKTQL